MYVYWPARFCHPEHKTTGAVFILGIIFDHFAVCHSVAQFLNCNATRDALVKGMFGKLKLICGDFGAKLVNHGCHILLLHYPACILLFILAVPPPIHYRQREETRPQPSIRPFDIPHECRKGQFVMTTTNLFALRGARSNKECCFFRSTCPLDMSRQVRQPPAASSLDQPIRRQVKQAQRRK